MTEEAEKTEKHKQNEAKNSDPNITLNKILIIITVISVIAAIIFYVRSIQIDEDKKELQEEKSELEKPLLITPDIRVMGDSDSVLQFIVRNPSHNIDYIYISGTCKADNPEYFTVPDFSKEEIKTTQEASKTPIVVPPTQTNEKVIPAGGSLTLYCKNSHIINPPTDMITFMNVCVNIKNIKEPICDSMQITILKS